MLNTVVLIGLVITLIIGLLFCLRGHQFLRIFIAIYAFWLGASRTYEFLRTYQAALDLLWIWIIAGAVGIILAVLAFVFIKFTLFLAGGLLGLAIYQMTAALNPVFFGSLGSGMSFVIGLIFFLIFGFIALAAKKFLLVLATSAWGAYTAVASAGILIGLLVSPPAGLIRGGTSLQAYAPYSIFSALPAALPVAAACVLAVIGMIVQYRRGGRRRRRA